MASEGNGGISSFGSRFRSDYEEFCGKASEDFVGKLQLGVGDDGVQLREAEDEASEHDSRDSFESAVSDQQHEEEEEEEEEFEFSFAGVNPDGSSISAEDVFQNGQIRPIYPLFDRSLLVSDCQDKAQKPAAEAERYPRPPLKKLFFEVADSDELDGVDEETYCVWNGKAVEEAASPEGCRKSNSTGFSKLWRFRGLVHRSSSDGKDAFVFLNTHRAHAGGEKVHRPKKEEEEVSREKGRRTAEVKEGKVKTVTVTAKAKGKTAHERHYVRNRAAKESDRRKSYLPYRQDLVGIGFFTNVNGMTRNVHPF